MKNPFKKNISGFFILFLMLTVVACGGNSETETETEQTSSVQAESDTADAPRAKLNINTASEEEFLTIPNVGDRMVHEFEEYRPYVSIRQFRQEIGKYVDEDQVAGYEEYIYVPVHRNESDLETLRQIPGLAESEAQAVLDERPFETNEEFLTALSNHLSKEELAVAKTYMKITE